MDKSVLEEFISVHRGKILKFIFSKVKNPQLAEDLTQEVFLRFIETVDDSEKIRDLKNYLFVIARNLVYDYWRKAANDRNERELYWREIQINKIVKTFPLIQEDKKIIFKYLEDQFTDQQKKIFSMNRREGLSYNEIAEQLHLSKSTVKNHMVAALKIIRKYMDEHSEKFIMIAGCSLFLP